VSDTGPMNPKESDPSEAFRLLPGVDEVLRLARVLEIAARSSSREVTSLVRRALEALRSEIAEGGLDAAALTERLAGDELAERVEALFAADRKLGVLPAINATGVVLHTGLGRAPVHPEVAERMAEVARSYCVLEVERASGMRNRRDDRLSELLSRVTGCEAAIAVNNNAAAVFLCLNTFASGGEGIVSRGELVEIGGSFRVPDVMTRAGVSLHEVGTTNRTRIADYRSAISEKSGILLKVHTSNFRVVGFTEEVSMEELAELGSEMGVTSAFDLGSGLIELEGSAPLDMLGGETRVREAVQSGLDVVSFSGDKLFGGPQAGLIVGRKGKIEALRQNPIYRALRLDKTSLRGLEVTLQMLLDGRGDEVPTRRMMHLTADELKSVAEELAAGIDGLPGLSAECSADSSQPGSGSAPHIFLDTWVVRVRHDSLSPDALGRRLRMGEPILFTRIAEDALVCDPRTLLGDDARGLLQAFAAIQDRPSQRSKCH